LPRRRLPAIGKAGENGKDLFVGDTLFAGSIGRVDLPGGDMDTLLASIRNVLFAFGDAAIVHPGHGPDTTIGRERRTNPYVAEAHLALRFQSRTSRLRAFSSTRPTRRRSPDASVAFLIALVVHERAVRARRVHHLDAVCRRRQPAVESRHQRASTMKSARGARPTVLMAPLRSRNVNPSSVGSERCRIHMAAYLTETSVCSTSGTSRRGM
jgi:hypothetical protein